MGNRFISRSEQVRRKTQREVKPIKSLMQKLYENFPPEVNIEYGEGEFVNFGRIAFLGLDQNGQRLRLHAWNDYRGSSIQLQVH